MVENPPAGMPRLSPYLLYADAGAAAEWLECSFGFAESMRLTDSDGRVNHAELTLEGAHVMIGCPGPDYVGPAESGHRHSFVHIYVDDVVQHYAQAEQQGVTIEEPLTDTFYGDRRYTAVDLEGHHWTFATHIRDVDLSASDS